MEGQIQTMARTVRGFTLIELMIVVAIVGILTAIALPAYQASVIKGNRTDAKAALIGFAQAMERHYAANFSYAGAADGGSDTGEPAATLYVAHTPVGDDTGVELYDLTIEEADATAYRLRATPVEDGPQEGDGYLEITQLGEKRWDRNNDGSIVDAEKTWEP